MANNYCAFSEMISGLSPKEEEWVEEKLGEMRECSGLPCNMELDGHDLWLYSEEGYEENDLIKFIQDFLSKFRPDEVFTMTVAQYCSKPRIKEFGGVWFVISKDQVENGTTWQAIDESKLYKNYKELGRDGAQS